MYQAKSGVKNFSLYLGGGGGSLDKNFFSPSLNMYQAKSGVKNFSLYWGGGGSLNKNFFPPVWTCIKPNLVSKIFPFTGGGGFLDKNFFPVWTCIKPNLVSKIFPFIETRDPPPPRKIWDLGPPPENLRPGTLPGKSETWDPPRKSETWDPPPENLRPGTLPGKSETWNPPMSMAGSGTPPPTWTWDPPSPVEVWTDIQSENITSRHPSDAGGNECGFWKPFIDTNMSKCLKTKSFIASFWPSAQFGYSYHSDAIRTLWPGYFIVFTGEQGWPAVNHRDWQLTL